MGHIEPIELQASAAYSLIIGSWVISAAFFAFLAIKVGKKAGKDNDGCLLAISNVLLAGMGGALGFLLFIRLYPYFVLSSMLGTVLLPALHTLYFARKRRR